MNKLFHFLLLVLCVLHGASFGQTYRVIVKGGHLIDPKNNIDRLMDVAINGDTIAKIAEHIPVAEGKQIIDASGMVVCPGYIDIHSHNFFGAKPNQGYSDGFNALPPDGFTFRNGVTTVVDAGGSGWKTFPTFKAQTIDNSKTRVLAFLNIVGEGMRGGLYEQNLKNMDAKLTAMVAKSYPQYIVGIKLAHYSGPEWRSEERRVGKGWRWSSRRR